MKKVARNLKNQLGFAHPVTIFLLVFVFAAVGFAGYRVFKSNNNIKAKASVSLFPTGTPTTLGVPALLVEQSVPNTFIRGKYTFATKTIAPYTKALAQLSSVNSVNRNLRYQLDLATGNSIFVLTTGTGSSGSNIRNLSSYNPTTNVVKKIIDETHMAIIAPTSSDLPEMCAGKGFYALSVSHYSNSTTPASLYIGTTSGSSQFKVVIDPLAQYANRLTCTSSSVYFQAGHSGTPGLLYKVALDPALKPKPINVTFSAISYPLSNFDACGGQFNNDQNLVFVIQPNAGVPNNSNFAVINMTTKTVKYIPYYEAGTGTNPYLGSCSVSPDGKTILISARKDFFATTTPLTSKSYLISTGLPSGTTFASGLTIDGWTGSNFTL